MATAVDRLRLAHRSGLVVLEQGWPIGVFSQLEALHCEECPAEEPVAAWMDARVVCLPDVLSVSRAAAQAIALGMRRIVVLRDGQPAGIVSGLDFAKLVHTAGT